MSWKAANLKPAAHHVALWKYSDNVCQNLFLIQWSSTYVLGIIYNLILNSVVSWFHSSHVSSNFKKFPEKNKWFYIFVLKTVKRGFFINTCTSIDRIPMSNRPIVLCMCRQHWTQQKTAFWISKPAKMPEAVGICYVNSFSNTVRNSALKTASKTILWVTGLKADLHREMSLTFWSIMQGYHENPGSGSRVLLRAMCFP